MSSLCLLEAIFILRYFFLKITASVGPLLFFDKLHLLVSWVYVGLVRALTAHEHYSCLGHIPSLLRLLPSALHDDAGGYYVTLNMSCLGLT